MISLLKINRPQGGFPRSSGGGAGISAWQGTSLRLATRQCFLCPGESGGNGSPGNARGPRRRRLSASDLAPLRDKPKAPQGPPPNSNALFAERRQPRIVRSGGGPASGGTDATGSPVRRKTRDARPQRAPAPRATWPMSWMGAPGSGVRCSELGKSVRGRILNRLGKARGQTRPRLRGARGGRIRRT